MKGFATCRGLFGKKALAGGFVPTVFPAGRFGVPGAVGATHASPLRMRHGLRRPYVVAQYRPHTTPTNRLQSCLMNDGYIFLFITAIQSIWGSNETIIFSRIRPDRAGSWHRPCFHVRAGSSRRPQELGKVHRHLQGWHERLRGDRWCTQMRRSSQERRHGNRMGLCP